MPDWLKSMSKQPGFWTVVGLLLVAIAAALGVAWSAEWVAFWNALVEFVTGM